MSNFDLAVGMTQGGVTQVINDLFENPIAKEKIFNGTFTKDLEGMGKVTLKYKIVNSPGLLLEPPSTEDWDESYKADPETTVMSKENMFQVIFTDVSGELTIDSEPMFNEEGELKVYCDFSITKKEIEDETENETEVIQELTLTPLAVWLDKSRIGKWDKIIVEFVVVPAILNMVTKMLKGIPLPQFPKIAGQSFYDPIAAIVNNNELVAATSLESNPPPSLADYKNPDKEIYLLTGLDVVNGALAGLKGKTFKEEGSSGGDGFNVEGNITATIGSVVASIAGTQTNISFKVIDVVGYGAAGGIGTGVLKALTCPIGTAIDAMISPSDWDKIMTNNKVSYEPDPLVAPVEFAVEASGTEQKLTVDVGWITITEVKASPKWNSSLTGILMSSVTTVLVSMFASLVQNILTWTIFKPPFDILKFKVISTTVEGITVELVIPDGSVAVAHGSNQLLQSFLIKFPQNS
jgi:hypothetical protein